MGGTFITFEGADGTGKSTQVRRLAAWLEASGIAHLVTREPGGTSAGLAIRSLVLEQRMPAIVPDAELLLYAADRAQHVHEVICPALASGLVVVCDRFTDATLAYQGYGRGLDRELIDELNQIATGGLEPDLTLVFDVDVDEATRRLSGRAGTEAPTRFDLEARDFHERVRAGYLAIARENADRIRLVDASGTEAAVADRVLEVVKKALGR